MVQNECVPPVSSNPRPSRFTFSTPFAFLLCLTWAQHLRLGHRSKTVWPFQPRSECSEFPWGCCGIVWLLGKQHHIGEANCPLTPITTHQPLPQLALITLWSRTGMMTQPVCRAGQIAVVNVPSTELHMWTLMAILGLIFGMHWSDFIHLFY